MCVSILNKYNYSFKFISRSISTIYNIFIIINYGDRKLHGHQTGHMNKGKFKNQNIHRRFV